MWVCFVICGCGCAAPPHQRPDHPFLHQTRYIHAPPPLVFNILKKSQYCFCKPLFLCTLWVARSMKALYARVAGPCNAWSLIIGRSVYLAWVGDDMIIIILADLIHEGWWYIINHCLSGIYPILTFATNRNTWFLDPPLFKTPILVRGGNLCIVAWHLQTLSWMAKKGSKVDPAAWTHHYMLEQAGPLNIYSWFKSLSVLNTICWDWKNCANIMMILDTPLYPIF